MQLMYNFNCALNLIVCLGGLVTVKLIFNYNNKRVKGGNRF